MTGLILLADGHSSRRRRLQGALRASGFEVETASDGASALEVALSLRPALVIADVDLPLVEAAKLAEILRANPRTESGRFVFLGEREGFREGGQHDEVLLPRGASLGDIVSTAESQLAIQQRLRALNQAVEEQERPTGFFPDLPLLEVMHCFHAWRCSGRIELRREGVFEGQGRGSVWLHDGEVVDAQVGATQGRKALYRLMQWERGHFALDASGLHVKQEPLAPLRSLLSEGTRQLSELARLADQLPSLLGRIQLRERAAELPDVLHPLTQEVLSLLKLHDTVRDVVDSCSYPDYQVLRSLASLSDRQIITIGRDEATGDSDPALFDDHQIRRLNEWALTGPAHSPDADLKLLVGASCREALVDFAALLRRLPGSSLAPDFEAGAVDLDSLAPLGRLDVGDGVAIELVNVPTREEMAPIWPVVGSEALGTLFLLAGSVAEAASNVQPMADALRRLPRSRIFNLFLFHKDEPISPSELGENLSLIDEASLFMVPLEGRKSAHSLLRSVFSRVVP